jgi:hypothetical protein
MFEFAFLEGRDRLVDGALRREIHMNTTGLEGPKGLRAAMTGDEDTGVAVYHCLRRLYAGPLGCVHACPVVDGLYRAVGRVNQQEVVGSAEALIDRA